MKQAGLREGWDVFWVPLLVITDAELQQDRMATTSWVLGKRQPKDRTCPQGPGPWGVLGREQDEPPVRQTHPHREAAPPYQDPLKAPLSLAIPSGGPRVGRQR